MLLFRFTVATARASAAHAGGIAITATGSVVIVANGVAKGVALITASGSEGSTSATTKLRVAGFGRPCAQVLICWALRIIGGLSPDLAFQSVDGADASANLPRLPMLGCLVVSSIVRRRLCRTSTPMPVTSAS